MWAAVWALGGGGGGTLWEFLRLQRMVDCNFYAFIACPNRRWMGLIHPCALQMGVLRRLMPNSNPDSVWLPRCLMYCVRCSICSPDRSRGCAVRSQTHEPSS